MAGSIYVTRRNKKSFLEAFARIGIVTPAAAEIGISRQTVYDWRKADPEFAAEMDAACEESTDLMEQEAHRRGVAGYDKPVYQGGVLVGTIREHSDTLLIFMLKARRPETYRDKPPVTIDSNAAGGVQIYLPERKEA